MKTSENEQIKSQIRELPDKPGIYKYYTNEEVLIYVGKAKSIKKRVASYFNKQANQDKKTKKLVSQIYRIEFTIVNTEFDAYLLENNLIKEHQPKYNILLRDDKTYPYLYIAKERFPRLIATRKLVKNLGVFYGPYTSVKAMNTVMDLVKKLFTLRTCNYNLSRDNIDKGKYKICLEYHIGNCRGPCENLMQEEEYDKNIDHIHHILKGNLGIVKGYFREQMNKLALELEYEKAQLIKEKIELLDKFQAGSIIVNPKLSDLEVLTLASSEDIAVVNYLYITNGLIVRTKTLEVKKKLQESDSEIIISALASIRNEWEISTNEILTNIEIEEAIEGVNIQNPKIGDKKKLIDLSYKNTLFELKRIKTRNTEKQNNKDRPILTLQKDLQLKEPPARIECFDNSNIQGTNPVAAVVCFINGKPAKKEYRHYNIKSVEGPDDYASMREVVFRRYKRQIAENQALPNLIVIDGGKGQLSAAIESLKRVELYGKIPIIGIAERLEEIYYPGDQYPLYLDKKSSSLKLLQYIRDEAHRFALTFHRNKRSQKSLNSSLSDIPGIGEKTFQKLIHAFKSVKKVKESSEEDIAKIIGPAKAKLLKNNLK